jgi:PAS domain S-box-containing protein
MSPEQFLQVADLFPDAALLLTEDGVVLAANRAAAALGPFPEGLMGRALADLAATPADAVRDYLRRCSRSQEPVAGSLVLRDGPGREVPCRCHGAVVDHDPHGGATRLLVRLARQDAEPGRFAVLYEEQARLRAEAQAHAERLRVTLASIGDAVIATDPEGRVTLLNPVARALTGWAPEEAAGRPLDAVFRIVNEHTRRPAENPVARALREGIVVGLANHTLLIARDGTERPIADSAAPIRDERGAIAGVVLVFRDATAERRAAETRRQLAAIVESSDDAIFAKTLDGVITTWNKGAERLYGYTAEEVIGRPVTILMPPEHADEFRAIMDKVGRREFTDHFETVRRRKDGTLIDVSVNISPVTDAEGRVVGASTIAREVTGRRRAERDARFLADASAALAEVEDYGSTLQKVAWLAVPHFADWCAADMLDEGGTLRRLAVAHVDPSKVELAQELHRRYPPDPAAPSGVWNILRTGRSETIPEITDDFLAATVADAELLRILRELGLRSYMGVPLRVRGKVLGVLTFVAAESGRRYDAADLTLAEDLAHRAAVAIENAQLYQAAREAARRKDEFLALLGHELRNPLAPLRNALHVLKLPGADPAIAERARAMMGRQLEYLVRLVDDLLDVSRIMRGKVELRREPVEVATVVARAVETAQPALDAEGHRLTVVPPPEPLWVHGDLVRLAQVVSNLLHNAAKYTERGGAIGLTAAREGGEAVLRVRDTGIGIPPEVLPRLFNMFFQAERRTKDSQGGLGIGLALVRGLVELHGGSVEAHSAGPGTGSEFVVRLPLLVRKKGDGEGPAPVDPGAAGGLPARRVLVVDDNVDAADSLAILLRLLGQEVGVAYDGASALAKAKAEPPAIAFLDLGMPKMDGYELARAFRADPALRRVVLVALTGWGQPEDRQRTREVGFDHHLVKPVEAEALQRLLAERLGVR